MLRSKKKQKNLLTNVSVSDKINESRECDKQMVFENWTDIDKLKTSNSFMSKFFEYKIKLFIESLILAQDERWRRA